MAGGERKSADSLLIVALAGGATREDAARKAGVSVATVYRRLQTPAFCQQVQEVRSEMFAQATGTLARMSAAAALSLAKLLQADSESVRLGAARAILELGQRFRESDELEQRLARLEEQAQAAPTPLHGGAGRWVA